MPEHPHPVLSGDRLNFLPGSGSRGIQIPAFTAQPGGIQEPHQLDLPEVDRRLRRPRRDPRHGAIGSNTQLGEGDPVLNRHGAVEEIPITCDEPPRGVGAKGSIPGVSGFSIGQGDFEEPIPFDPDIERIPRLGECSRREDLGGADRPHAAADLQPRGGRLSCGDFGPGRFEGRVE